MMIMVGSSGAAEQDIDGQQLLSNIMLEGAGATGALSCTGSGQSCASHSECCPHTACRYLYNKCEWCPAAGDSCGRSWHCCPGFTCYYDSFWTVTGTCS
ncbi:hypothetical protein SOVF_084290 [Spinacia oleracea]|nr:hypothetical protein SOVF_084290 [Spinacia oleracea]